MEVKVDRRFHVWRWRLIAVWVVAFTGFVAWQLHTASSTHSALCALKTDLVVRVQAGEDFLAEHPDGIPGLPASLIRNGISNQKKTIEALRGLECSNG